MERNKKGIRGGNRMMFVEPISDYDKIYNSHDFNRDLERKGFYFFAPKCKNCGITSDIFSNYPMLSCDEQIIKNIIE